MSELTASRVREVVSYCPETGHFHWKATLSNRAQAGKRAGTLHKPSGYTVVSIDRNMVKAHRLAWFYVTGAWPDQHIDHINGDRSDNRFANLREANPSLNQQNLRAARGETHSGMLGVYRTDKKTNKWRASIKHDGRDVHLGNFPDIESAHSAYVAAKRKFHAGCTI